MAYRITQDAYNKLMGLSDPEKLKKEVEKTSQGMKTIKPISQLEGSGLNINEVDPGGYGYVFSETERAKQMYNPNSAEFRQKLIQNEIDRRNEADKKIRSRQGSFAG